MNIPTGLSMRLRSLIALTVLLAVSAVAFKSGTAQSPTQEAIIPPPPPPRAYDNWIPKHVPIKVKVKNLNNEKWVRDLEVEVTNVSDKPIYYLKLAIQMGVKSESGDEYGYPLRYGRPKLVNIAEPVLPEDVPLYPGESHTFKLSESYWRGWEHVAAEKKLKKHEPRKIGIKFGVLNFGDGTGFVTTGAKPVVMSNPSNFLPR